MQFGETGLLILATSGESIRTTERTQYLFLFVSALLIAFLLYLLITYLSNKRALFETAANFSAEKRSREKIQAFLGDVSHELRTPLTVIKGYVELVLAQEEMDSITRKRQLTRVSNEIIRMEELIRDLLQLAELGEAPDLEKELIDIAEIARGFVEDEKLLQPERPMELLIPEQLQVEASRKLMSQVISNIFQNARRHSASDAQIRFELKQVDGGILLSYEDAGPGISDEILADRSSGWFRFDKNRSREAGGSGLGLSLIAAVVKAHNGELEIGRSRWNGFKIEITLPNK
jgi:two-component system OmpR family sensor kinase